MARTFSLKSILYSMLVIGVLLFAALKVNDLVGPKGIPSGAYMVKIRDLDAGDFPFRRNQLTCALLDWWILKETKSARMPLNLREDYEFIFFDTRQKEAFRFSCYSDIDRPDDGTMFMKLGRSWRSGSASKLAQIVSPPDTVVSLDGNWVRYQDSDNDGKIDKQFQCLDTHGDIVWEDTNSDGYFDAEYLWDHQRDFVCFKTVIRMPVPQLEEESDKPSDGLQGTDL